MMGHIQCNKTSVSKILGCLTFPPWVEIVFMNHKSVNWFCLQVLLTDCELGSKTLFEKWVYIVKGSCL